MLHGGRTVAGVRGTIAAAAGSFGQYGCVLLCSLLLRWLAGRHHCRGGGLCHRGPGPGRGRINTNTRTHCTSPTDLGGPHFTRRSSNAEMTHALSTTQLPPSEHSSYPTSNVKTMTAQRGRAIDRNASTAAAHGTPFNAARGPGQALLGWWDACTPGCILAPAVSMRKGWDDLF